MLCLTICGLIAECACEWQHATVIQYILSTFNQIMRYVRLLEDVVEVTERHLSARGGWSGVADEDGDTTEAEDAASMFDLPANTPRRESLDKCAGEFKRQSHFLVVMLTAMAKHSASTHVSDILTRLNYNYFYHSQQPQQQHRATSGLRDRQP